MQRSLLHTLKTLHFITPRGIIRWVRCFASEGITLMAMLKFSATYYPERCALVSDTLRLNYSQLYQYAQQLAHLLYSDYGLNKGDVVGVLCRNHVISLLLLPALSRLGVHVRLLNTDLGEQQVEGLVREGKYKLLVFDEEIQEKCVSVCLPCRTISTETLFNQVFAEHKDSDNDLPRIFQGPEITVMTGGTSGKYTEASRHPSVTQFLCPFFALLKDIGIGEYESVCLALPFYHGFGLTTLIVSLLMGKKICLMRHFETDQALEIIQDEKVEVFPIVPVLLARIWQQDDAREKLRSLRCIISGGDRLDRKLIEETQRQLGNVLYNLYGTSEAGFVMLATPEDLSRHEETTLGKPIHGVKCAVRDKDKDGIGTLWIRSRWAMTGQSNRWQNTGDRVWCDAEGYYFHRGRADQLIVCGGENAYPDNVMRALSLHPDVVTSHVYAVPDHEFGNVLNARIELRKDASLTSAEIIEWLRPRITRAEMPHKITFGPIETLSSGKQSFSYHELEPK
ncbi:MAG: AMP-binding protein [Bacteroidales bacterium]|nr:AMP-binding protein [Bacteroidales bacterium]